MREPLLREENTFATIIGGSEVASWETQRPVLPVSQRRQKQKLNRGVKPLGDFQQLTNVGLFKKVN